MNILTWKLTFQELLNRLAQTKFKFQNLINNIFEEVFLFFLVDSKVFSYGFKKPFMDLRILLS